ncbi:MAG: MerR family DNA-binding transcriptional regulator [Candidatus Paceibacterota bacterium]
MSVKLVTIGIAAHILGVNNDTLRHWDNQGKLVATRDKQNNYRLYRVSDLRAFARRHGLKVKTRRIID